MRIFLTGGTGFLGSFIADAALAAGHDVRALARPTSDIQHLASIGADVVRGDLADAAGLERAASGCDIVIHAAARVIDWAPWEDYHEDTVAGTRRLYDAAVAAGVPRAMHVSTVGVYGKEAVLAGAVDESMGPVPEERLPRWYFYGRAKSMAESLAMRYHTMGRMQVSVLRPAWIYGPRERSGLPKLLTMLEKGRVRLIGDGSNVLSLTYVANVADAALLCATQDAALGEAFNVCNDNNVTQREYLDALAAMLGVPPVRRILPYNVALGAAATLEAVHRGLRLPRRPVITRHGVQLVGLPSTYTTEKIRTRLGWEPKVGLDAAIARIKEWWEAEGPKLRKTA